MPKRSAPFSKAARSEPKRLRKTLTIGEKVKVLDMIKEGRSYAAVGRHYGLNESTIRYIKKEEENIRATAAVSCHQHAKRVASSRNMGIVRMESALALWISDSRQKNIPLNTNVIREKAKELYARYTEGAKDEPVAGPSAEPASPKEFMASKGWFDKFQKRFKLKSMSLRGDDKAARLAKLLGDMTSEVNALIDTHMAPLTDEDVAHMTKSASEEEEQQAKEEEEEQQVKEEEVGLSVERLTVMVTAAKDLQGMAHDWDPQMIRALRFRNAIDDAIEVYKNILNLMSKQRQQPDPQME